jgi:predicted HTH transcriptional regulator
LYFFSTIRSNRFSSIKRLDDVVIIPYPEEFKKLELPIQEAVCALLNNKGGFILIGLQKKEGFYLPNCSLKFSERIANDART